MKPYFQDDAVQLFQGDCFEVMKGLTDNSIDTIITDPPYGLHFMGKKWDYEIPSVAVFTEMLRVAKYGATLLCFGGTRTWHRIAVNIEDAGWEIRDTLMWIYGSGFPKSLDIGKAVDKTQGNERECVENKTRKGSAYQKESPHNQINGKAIDGRSSELIAKRIAKSATDGLDITKGNSPFEGYGTALKPAFEPIIMAMKPCEGTFAENALKHGVAGLNIDGARVGDFTNNQPSGMTRFNDYRHGKGKYPTNEVVTNTIGRFPANIIHDGSEEVLAGFPQNAGAFAPVKKLNRPNNVYGKYETFGDNGASFRNDSGSASRFFYCAKASKAERNAGCEGLPIGEPPASARSKPAEGRDNPLGEPRANHHPTVKPLALMEYLCTLTKTPTGGIVLDPYMGSGTTGMACKKTGRDFIGIEISEEYLEIAKRRIESAKRMAQTVMELNV